jgi:hypothetical protein
VIGSLGEEVSVVEQKAQLASTASETAAGNAVIAERTAANAQAASSKAKEAAEKAQSEADSFERDIVLAKEQSTEAESHLADALNKAADANRRALAAQQALDAYRTPRSLTKEQQDRIVTKLNTSIGKRVDVMVSVAPQTFEGLKFSEYVLAALSSAWGGRILGDPSVMAGVGGVSGVWVFPTRQQRSIDAADLLVSVLIAAGISAVRSDKSVPGKFLMGCEKVPDAKPDDPYCSHVLVLIGVKP